MSFLKNNFLFKNLAFTFKELFEDNCAFLSESKNRLNSIITGRIVEIERDFVIIDLGLKSEGIVPLEEFRDDGGEYRIKKGDQTEVFLKSIDDGLGHTVVSRIGAVRFQTVEKIKNIFKNEETIFIKIKSTFKGGLIGSYQGIECFLPGSLIDTSPVRDFNDFVNSEFSARLYGSRSHKNKKKD